MSPRNAAVPAESAQRSLRSFLGGRRNELSNGLAEAGDQHRLSRLAHSLEDSQARRFEFRDGNFFHRAFLVNRTMVNDHGQSFKSPASPPHPAFCVFLRGLFVLLA